MIDYVFLEKYTKDIEVLFVEDDEIIKKETKELLEEIFQKEITVASNGKEGLDKYNTYYSKNNKYFDLVITDIQMPIMNGIEFTKEIYSINTNQSLIVLSAHNDSKYLMELINLGITQFILKPLDYDNFVDVIYKVSKEIYFEIYSLKDEYNPIINLASELYWNKDLDQLLYNGQIVKLTKKEFLLMKILLKIPDKTHTIEEILLNLYSDTEDKSPDVSNLKNIIARLRKKVPELIIENVYSFGYRLNIMAN
jgi:DNA-binding response OmpR family regulator